MQWVDVKDIEGKTVSGVISYPDRILIAFSDETYTAFRAEQLPDNIVTISDAKDIVHVFGSSLGEIKGFEHETQLHQAMEITARQMKEEAERKELRRLVGIYGVPSPLPQ